MVNNFIAPSHLTGMSGDTSSATKIFIRVQRSLSATICFSLVSIRKFLAANRFGISSAVIARISLRDLFFIKRRSSPKTATTKFQKIFPSLSIFLSSLTHINSFGLRHKCILRCIRKRGLIIVTRAEV